MFTGIVEELGRVRSVTPNHGGAHLELECRSVLDDAEIGASIAVNGCCLTVVEFADDWWAADAQTETLERTTLGGLGVGDPVNLERPVRVGDRLGGHLVQGHVDGVGRVVDRGPLPDGSTHLSIELPPELSRYVVEKGSITIDGVSLTVTHIAPSSFGVALIPHTLAVTTFGVRSPGDVVNLEVDVLAKYVERLLSAAPSDTRSVSAPT